MNGGDARRADADRRSREREPEAADRADPTAGEALAPSDPTWGAGRGTDPGAGGLWTEPATRGGVGRADVRRAVEALLFVADEPLSSAVLAQVVEVGRREVESVLEGLSAEYEERGSGLVLRRVAGGWRLFTHPEARPHLERFILSARHARLTRASLETLAIVAYKQPVTRHQVSSIRGVDSDGVLRSLVERGLVEEVGREDGPGRPVLYGTTGQFLERLGLASLSDLPPVAPLIGEGGGDGHGPLTGEGGGDGHGPLTGEGGGSVGER